MMMPQEITLVAALLVGLFGSVHCIGMCGGIAGALTMGLSPDRRRSIGAALPYVLAYNVGRIGSYTLAGAIAGLVGEHAANLFSLHNARTIGLVISALFLIALGLYLGGWWQVLSVLERAGTRLWRRIEPYGRRLLPVRNPAQALGLGAIWGWLPCGLVYATLAWSLTTGSAQQGALLMLAFGLGTLPMLLVLGTASRWLSELTRRLVVRRAVGALVIAFGVFTLIGGHQGHQHAPTQETTMSAGGGGHVH
jgi:sulfite exporter TauE/SafE